MQNDNNGVVCNSGGREREHKGLNRLMCDSNFIGGKRRRVSELRLGRRRWRGNGQRPRRPPLEANKLPKLLQRYLPQLPSPAERRRWPALTAPLGAMRRCAGMDRNGDGLAKRREAHTGCQRNGGGARCGAAEGQHWKAEGEQGASNATESKEKATQPLRNTE